MSMSEANLTETKLTETKSDGPFWGLTLWARRENFVLIDRLKPKWLIYNKF